MKEYSLSMQNLINIVEATLGDKATKNGKIDLDNEAEVSCFTTMLEKIRKNNSNVKFDEQEIAQILGFEKSTHAKPVSGSSKIYLEQNGFTEHDEKGNMTKCAEDTDGDGIVDYIAAYEYDQKGRNTKFTEDTNGDGIIDRVLTWEYDESGKNTKFAIDKDGDGKIDRVVNWENVEKK